MDMRMFCLKWSYYRMREKHAIPPAAVVIMANSPPSTKSTPAAELLKLPKQVVCSMRFVKYKTVVQIIGVCSNRLVAVPRPSGPFYGWSRHPVSNSTCP
uniref:Uncharacterized protein n=1 Tax=Physcomitrium patens TaxID=3218 RepID=A0A2K1JHK4_PHYPA|nr:hypothetical protein PHYPA_018402 [Physcomitrium patens]